MKKYQYVIGFVICCIGLFVGGIWLGQVGENYLMGEYGLYQCIYNNDRDSKRESENV